MNGVQKSSITQQSAIQKARSGTFVDNMKLPVHRWFRYSAGFSAVWVENILSAKKIGTVLDPFVGSGTVCVVADKLGIPSYGAESHPFIFRLARGKLAWHENVVSFESAINRLIEKAVEISNKSSMESAPELITKCYSNDIIRSLYGIKNAYFKLSHEWAETINDLVFLAINSILRVTSHVGTAQWQYILPNKTKSRVISPYDALKIQAKMMMEDMKVMQCTTNEKLSILLQGDARTLLEVPDNSIDYVITSPPYANNYDYADATRLEMTFWGEINSWKDLHDSVRQYLVCSSSQHAAKDKLHLSDLLDDCDLVPIKGELSKVCEELDIVRKTKSGKKAYHLMLAAYFNDMSKTFKALRRVAKQGAEICFVIGDSAPYGVYAPVERWFGELALAHGFTSWEFEKIRDRNVKWKNRKHNIPLHEGHLWIKG